MGKDNMTLAEDTGASKRAPLWLYGTGLLGLTVCCLIWLVLDVPYYTVDDSSLASIAAGVYGREYSGYAPFCNFFYNVLLSGFYRIIPSVNWFAVYPMILGMIGIVCVMLLMLHKLPDEKGLLLTVFFVLLFGHSFFVKFQFTTASAMIGALGLLLMYSALGKDEKFYRILSAIGLVLAFNSLIIRTTAFCSVAVVFAVCCLARILQLKFWQWKPSRILRQASPFLILFALGLAAVLIDYWLYASDPEWAYWMAYNNARSRLLDYRTTSYEEAAAQYSAAGIDAMDYALLNSWHYGDKTKFSLETLLKLGEFQDTEGNVTGAALLSLFVRNLYEMTADEPALLLVLAAALGLMFAQKKNLWLLAPLAMLFVEILWMTQVGRLLFRSYVGIWAGLALILIFTAAEMAEASSAPLRPSVRRLTAGILFLAVLFVPEMGRDLVNSRERLAQEAQWRAELQDYQMLTADSEILYVKDVSADPEPPYSLCLPPIQEPENHVYNLGGWMNPSPLMEHLLDDYGVPDRQIMPALLNPELNLYYVDRLFEDEDEPTMGQRVLMYLQKEYDPDARMEIVDQQGDYSLVRFHSDPYAGEADPEQLGALYHLEQAQNTDKLTCALQTENTEEGLVITGSCSSEGMDPYRQNAWLEVTGGGRTLHFRGEKTPDRSLIGEIGNPHGAGAGVTFRIGKELLQEGIEYRCSIILEADGEMLKMAAPEIFPGS